MRKRSRIALALLLLAAIGGIVWLALSSSEPMYQGKRLSVWLEDYDVKGTTLIYIGSGDRNAAPDEAVRHIGTNAIPTLLRRLRANDSLLKLRLLAFAKKQSVFKVTSKPAWTLRQEGIHGFQVLGAEGKAAVPALVRMLEQDHELESQYAAATALGYIGPAAEHAVPALVRSLGHTNLNSGSFVMINIDPRRYAMGALYAIHSHPEIVVPALIKFFSDQAPDVRLSAASICGTFGSDARLAVPGLLQLRADLNGGVRDAAEEALRRIDPEAAAKAGVK